MARSTTLLFISVTLLVASLDCGYRAWTLYFRPMNEFHIANLVAEMGNFVIRTGSVTLGWELLFRRRQCATFINSVVKLDYGLKSEKPKC